MCNRLVPGILRGHRELCRANTVEEVRDLIEGFEKNQANHETAGHWVVPTCAYKGEPFFGPDRLDVLLWRLQKEGLQIR